MIIIQIITDPGPSQSININQESILFGSFKELNKLW